MKTLRRKRKRERGEGYQPYSRMGGISRTGTEGAHCRKIGKIRRRKV